MNQDQGRFEKVSDKMKPAQVVILDDAVILEQAERELIAREEAYTKKHSDPKSIGYKSPAQFARERDTILNRFRRRRGLNPRRIRTEPLPTLGVGEGLTLGEAQCTVEKIKADGKLRLWTCGGKFAVDDVEDIKGILFRVVWTNETHTGLKMLNRAQVEAWKEGIKLWATQDAVINVAPPPTFGKYPLPAPKPGEGKNHAARVARREKRLQGIADRRAAMARVEAKHAVGA